GCGALHTYSDGQAEIAAIAVDTKYEELGIGRKVVEFLMQRAAERKVPRVFALTTQSYDWFHARGFRTGTVEDLPPEKQTHYDRERNSRILLYDL
ncbi:MAG: GNAT family N-acetyltransferase, partial [Spirochaeta sp.]|nr:GNAT family N-acetyltransferase [Spirochaeta sp.]